MNVRLRGERAFAGILAGQMVSTVGSAMTRFGLVIWTLAETGDTTAYSLLLLASFLPLGLGALVAGPLVDRLDRRHVMIVANMAASLSTLAIAGLYVFDSLSTWHLYVALFVNGVANAFVLPAFDASVPLLVRKEQLGRAAGLSQMIAGLEMILGPALAGVVLGVVGLGAIFIIDFVTFGASIAALLLAVIPRPPRESDEEPSTGIAGEFAAGWRYLNERPPLRLLLGLVTTSMLLMPGFGFALCTPLVLSFANEQAAGMVLASFGFGALASGVLLAAWGGPKRRMHGVLVALVGAALAMVVIGLRESVIVTAIGVAAIGMSFTTMMALSRVIWQVKVAPSFLGRVFSLRIVFGVGAQCLGLMLAAPLAQGVFEPLMASDGALASSVGSILGVGPGRGMGLMYGVVAIAALTLAAASWLVTSLRRIEDILPDTPDTVPSKPDLAAQGGR